LKPQPVQPGPGQESVWDYPRPPRVEKSTRHILVRWNEITLADSCNTFRVLETSHPPTYYIPYQDVAMDHLRPSDKRSFCEWKGRASYYDFVAGTTHIPSAGWTYEDPSPAFAPLRGHLAFYPDRLECFLDGERVRAQAGGFYGGWITRDIVGPFKGEAETRKW
jgi:uncharacterized protein (DUF427 family)